MIEINLRPGGGKKGKAKSGISLGSAFSGFGSRIKSAYLLTAVASLAVAVLSVGGLHLSQQAEASELAGREEAALRDSARYSAVITERRRLEARRDSVVRQLEIIKAIDSERFVWAHLLDEVSRALPPYTWLKTMAAANAAQVPGQPTMAPTPAPAPAPAPAAKPGEKADTTKQIEAVPFENPVKFKIISYTVDIQALTRFMKVLETSPFIQKVHLAKSELVVAEGKEVTEFTLELETERPTPDAIVTVPVSLSAR